MATRDNPERTTDVRFLLPGTMCILGPTCAGKTHWLVKLLADLEAHFNTLGGERVRRVVYCHNSAKQACFESLKRKGVEFHEGMPPSIEALFPTEETRPGILILDDLMTEINAENGQLELLTTHAHHYNLFVIFTQQTPHPRGKNAVAVRQNCHYKVLFNFPAEKEAVKRYLRNLQGGKALDWLFRWYKKVTTHSDFHRYMVVASHPLDANLHSFRTNVLSTEAPAVVYKENR